MANCLQTPAFVVGEIDGNINLSLPPASGEEYIKRVVIETQHCADVVVADIDRTRLEKPTIDIQPLSGCVKAPPCLSPALEWQECQVSDFSEIRMYISQLKDEIQTCKRKWKPPQIELPTIEDEKCWVKLCTGQSEEEAKILPTLNTVFCLNQPTVEQVLEYLVNYLECEEKMGYELQQWIYALLVVLEMPLTPDTCSCLRSLARACSIIRANTTDLKVREIGALNLFICLVSRYFRQLDLADP